MIRILLTLVLVLGATAPSSATLVIDNAEIAEDLQEATDLYQEEIADNYSELNPHIPEPMIFDLVRPLGAKKGEMEINTIIKYDPGDGHLIWSPEIEFMLDDKLGVEIELPFNNESLEAVKFALQKTFEPKSKKFIHGLQNLYRYDFQNSKNTFDNTYIAGYRFNKSFSDIFMKGIRLSFEEGDATTKGLFNNTLFYEYKKFKLGLETNLVYGTSRNNYFILMPQIQFPIRKNLFLQLGTGTERSGDSDSQSLSTTSAARLIFEI